VSDARGGSGQPGQLSGRCIVVTGAAGGIGKACAVEAARAGAALVLADADEAGLSAAAAELVVGGADVVAVPTDVTDEEQCARLAATAGETFGRLDGAVLSAGIARHVPLLEMTRHQWDRMLAVHLTGAFLRIRAAATAMLRAGARRLAGVPGVLGNRRAGSSASGALRRGEGRRARPCPRRRQGVGPSRHPRQRGVTRVHPNRDERRAVQRGGRAPPSPGRTLGPGGRGDGRGRWVTFLLGDHSGLMTGQTLHVNGGTHMP
jgi:3-oxoacyl-[acyl-carrier protein] reductase